MSGLRLPCHVHSSLTPPTCLDHAPPRSNRTDAFAALLQLLRNPPGEVLKAALPKYFDLVVKCLIKLTKGMMVGALITTGCKEITERLVFTAQADQSGCRSRRAAALAPAVLISKPQAGMMAALRHSA